MSAEHSHRWQHRTHAAVTQHWHDDDPKPQPGSTADCETCTPKEDE